MKKYISVALFLLILLPAYSFAGKSSPEIGKQLFEDPALGGSSTAQSCNSCHAGGNNLKSAANNPKLTQAINRCLTERLMGEKIDGRTANMRSIKMYIKTIPAN